jgi:hypothetical protein
MAERGEKSGLVLDLRFWIQGHNRLTSGLLPRRAEKQAISRQVSYEFG